MDEEVLLAIYKEFSSTKNALLLEQKKYTDPIQIAYRDWSIIGVEVILRKIEKIIKEIRSSVITEDFNL